MKHQDNRWWDEHSKKRRKSEKPVKKKPPSGPVAETVNFEMVNFEMGEVVSFPLAPNPEFLQRVEKLVAKYSMRNYRYPMKANIRSGYNGALDVYLEFGCNCRDTGKEVGVNVICRLYAYMTDAIMRDKIRYSIREFVLHEMQECLFFDGERENDPHKPMFGYTRL